VTIIQASIQNNGTWLYYREAFRIMGRGYNIGKPLE